MISSPKQSSFERNKKTGGLSTNHLGVRANSKKQTGTRKIEEDLLWTTKPRREEEKTENFSSEFGWRTGNSPGSLERNGNQKESKLVLPC